MTDIWDNLNTQAPQQQSGDIWAHLNGTGKANTVPVKGDPLDSTDTYTAGLGRFLVGAARGVEQLGAKVGNKLGLVSDQTVSGIQSDIDDAAQRDQALMGTLGGKLGYGTGAVALGALAAPESIAGSALYGGALGGIQPTQTGESRLSNVEQGALAGGAGAAIGKAGGALFTGFGGSAGREGAVETLLGEGVPLSVAQRTGSKLAQHIERASAMTGDEAGEFAATQAQAFNRAVLRRVGVTDPEVTAATPEVLSGAKTAITDVMNAIAERNNVKLDEPLLAGLSDIKDQLARTLPESDSKPILTNIADIESNAAANGGLLDGKFVQKLRSNLSFLEKNPATSPVAGDFKDVIDDALTRTATENGNAADVAALGQARRQYRALKQIEPAVNASTGDISPLALMRSMSLKSNRAQALYGVGDQSLMDLARAGKQVLPDSLGNSGTAERLLPAVSAIETLASGNPVQAGAKLAAGKLGISALGSALRKQGLEGQLLSNGLPGGKVAADLIRKPAAPIAFGLLGSRPAYADQDQTQ